MDKMWSLIIGTLILGSLLVYLIQDDYNKKTSGLIIKKFQNASIEESPNVSIQELPPKEIPKRIIYEHIIKVNSSGFYPNILEINNGDKVIFVNIGDQNHWPASARHPVHDVYPGSNLQKCGTMERDKIFDSCGQIAYGEIYSFVFNEIGSWKYHDHLHPSLTGTIIVN
ncbi:MAG: hypothetical protein QT05_C0008G0006 [archaeon GW2011_AR13]|nr:MAG: hypothetical protein QT05_C0008G0006 [archaeon GW2011_AR13]HIG95059.1 hypothetical protein [Nanoarchaeota archaeon]HIH62765.1 hypothetical protein [Nanoarchaeota archaeon]HIJ09993.1 hypothetical protein [Nanoarchaeota archaeon]